MKIAILYFASVREAVGTDREAAELPDGVRTVGQVREWLIARGGAWAQVLAAGRAVRMARNHTMVTMDEAIEAGDEVAFFPPVTGG